MVVDLEAKAEANEGWVDLVKLEECCYEHWLYRLDACHGRCGLGARMVIFCI